jgi:uncharacterized repeat protein (TIGR03803 family)
MPFMKSAVLILAGLAVCTAARADNLNSIYSFAGGNAGATPLAGPVYGKRVLYGTTSTGGKNGGGTIFQVDTATGAATVLYNFATADGTTPMAQMFYQAGKLYGTTSAGGKKTGCGGGGCGTAFEYDIASGKYTVLHDFSGGSDGGSPGLSGLTEAKGVFYGTTVNGGPTNNGLAYGISKLAGFLGAVGVFKGGKEPANPNGGVVWSDGRLYGTSQGGGSKGLGTVYQVRLSTEKVRVLHSFAGGSDGAQPMASMLLVNGVLYGTTAAGGASSAGTIFSYDLTKPQEAVLYSFGGANGAAPATPLIYNRGIFDGTTSAGGTGNVGTVFSFDPKSSQETVLYSFTGAADGGTPNGIWLDKLTLYGTTQTGGANGYGTVFGLAP